MKIRWNARLEPLEPVAVAATGEAARQLARSLLSRTDEELKRLRGVSWLNGIAVEGAFAELPWADGALYLGRDERAPRFLWPSNLEPDGAPLELVARALERGLALPVLVLPGVQTLVSLAEARALEREKLEQMLDFKHL